MRKLFEKHLNAGLFIQLCCGVFLFLLSSSIAYANEVVLSVSGNGSDSTSQVSANNASATQVSQNNQAAVANNAQNTTDTGNNQASSNTGGATSLQTGSATYNTIVANNQINTNVANSNCGCPTNETTAQIMGNGSGSRNAINTSSTTSTIVDQNNTAHITNNVQVNADTGHNSANDNTGNTQITTGDIHSNVEIHNSNINQSESDVPSSSNGSSSVKISGNGSDSTNIIDVHSSSNTAIFSHNSADIFNSVLTSLNTGSNFSNRNTGNVGIVTGTILSRVVIDNEGINTNIARVLCGCEAANQPSNPPSQNQPPQTSAPAPVQETTTSSSPGDGSSAGESVLASAGQVLGAVTGEILPITGGYWFLIAMLANSLMFFMGWYLRMRSGRSPNVAFA